MLVLTRKVGESIMIDDRIEVTVLEVEGETLKIGLKAPREVKIYRKEVYEEIQKANREALKHQHINLEEWLNLINNDQKNKDNQ